MKKKFQKLLNEGNEKEEAAKVAGLIETISLKEVKTEINTMKNDEASGPSGVTSDLFKYAGKSGVVALHESFEKIVG